MQREIKFRGQRIDNKEWVYGFVYRHDPPLQCFDGEGKELPSFAILKTGFADWNMQRPIDQHQVDGKTIGEFTSDYDKNGKEIYEGDILRRSHNPESKFVAVIQFKNGMFGGTTKPGDNHFIEMPRLPRCDHGGTGYDEIIGNIYESPSLLNS